MEPRDSRIPSSSPLLGNKPKKLLRFFINFLNKKRRKKQFMFGFEKWAEWYGGEAEWSAFRGFGKFFRQGLQNVPSQAHRLATRKFMHQKDWNQRQDKEKQGKAIPIVGMFPLKSFNVEAYVRLTLLGCSDPEEVLSTIIYTFFCSILKKELTLSKHIYCIFDEMRKTCNLCCGFKTVSCGKELCM